tara:strand:+ start:122 stop:499 length:378 start_codon:yes stop_codon:yes gene_type:complete
MICVKNLPYDIKQKILNYLYYSNNTTTKLKPCLVLINSYYKIIYDEIYDKIIGGHGIYKLTLRWINLHENQFIYNFIENNNSLNYDLIDKTRQDNHALYIIKQLTINQIKKLYLYLYDNEYIYMD